MAIQETPHQLLDVVYEELEYHDGALLNATSSPPKSTDSVAKTAISATETWTNKGEWLSLASQIEAEKLFFVGNDPVIVFHRAPDDEPQRLMEIFRKSWCMARPQLLFIAFPGGLDVYSLNQPPAQTLEEWENIKPLDAVRRVSEVSEKLQAYRREQVETRQIFREKENLGMLEQRADKRLILDLKEVRQQLLAVDPNIDAKYIHALIGRSIFIRYLEDRDILSPDYFRQIAQNQAHPKWSPDWLEVLDKPEIDLAPNSEKRWYSQVLRNKDFTYALFDQLAEHFNGDMFPQDPEEERAITEQHLQLLHRFLLGDTDPQQPKLFLWAYDFRVIPLELISSIYEEFYHESSKKETGTHYTPSVLVEYVLSQVLTVQRLAQRPRVLDFACGSAIFLVQAYRRIVRYEESLLRRPLTNQELRQILRDQIAGIEVNEEAIHVAAFSLYLALLHYQEPKSILAQIAQTDGEKPLPYIILDANHHPVQDSAHYNILYRGNAFSLMDSERELIKQRLDESSRFKGRVEWERLYASESTLPFEPNSFDVIVGNPPWGYVKKSEVSPELHLAQEHTLRWCDVFGWSIGDKELSQAFIARSLSLLKSDGECGLLVSAGVFLKRHRKSEEFRKRWLQNSTIEQVTNFIHVRDMFFSSAISPFCFVQYHKGSPPSNHILEYWSVKKTDTSIRSQFVVLTLYDLHKVRQWEMINNDLLWKVYWWGNHRDAAFINSLCVEDKLHQLAKEQKWPRPQRGFENQRTTAKSFPSGWLKDYKELPVPDLKRYGSVKISLTDTVPDRVRAYGSREIYEGWRLLIKQGITQAMGANGRIDCRLENLSYCFQSSIYGINVDRAAEWQRKLLIGILWSSLARYYFFMIASSWGTWRHKIYLRELMHLPIRVPDNSQVCRQIIEIVEELRQWNPTTRTLLKPNGLTTTEIEDYQQLLEHKLDKNIFDLYELTEPERDLVLDLCETELEFFYRADQSAAIQRIAPMDSSLGTMTDLPGIRSQEVGLQGYLYAFLQMWNPQLETIGGEFNWRVIRALNVPMLAVVFTTQQKGDALSVLQSPDEKQTWYELLKNLDSTLQYPISERIYIDGMVRAVTDTNVFIIKRDERRLWTRSLAREDAEATLVQAANRRKALGK